MKIEELVLMRIFVGENDRFERKPLYQALVDCFKENGLAGATVTKAVMGYGGHSEIHTDHLLRLSSELPVVIETVDTQEKIDVV
ncbi:MAG: DUF190 domain-containing protein, partial [Desulfuromonadales bacterium]|nr:DUF190 domain-containing protein [Desulfuromonadales bacterium]